MMDAEALPKFDIDDEEWDGSEEMRKRKLDEYMNELYGMEFNDIVRLHVSVSSNSLYLPAVRLLSRYRLEEISRLDLNTHQSINHPSTSQQPRSLWLQTRS